MKFEKGTILDKLVSELKVIFESVKKKSLMRLKHENAEKDKKRLNNPTG